MSLTSQSPIYAGKLLQLVLIGNYSLDGQYSMLQFANFLLAALQTRGLKPILLQPKGYLGCFFKNCPRLRKYLGYIDKYLIFPLFLKAFIRKHKDASLLFHILDHSNALYYPYLKDWPTLVSCHDMIAVKAALGKTKAYKPGFLGQCLQRWILRHLRAIPTMVCLSKATQTVVASLLKRPKGSLPIVYLSSPYTYQPMDRSQAQLTLKECLPSLNRKKPYLLHVGNDAWYKNRDGLLYIYKALKDALGAECPCLILVGPNLNLAEEALVARHQLEVLPFKNLRETVINALYAAAECLILPSIEEGLGLPILEAMAVGCPVVCTHMEPFTEVGGKAAMFIAELQDFSPQGKEAWAQASVDSIIALLKEPSHERQKRLQVGFQQASLFSRKRVLEGYFRIYETVLSEHSSK